MGFSSGSNEISEHAIGEFVQSAGLAGISNVLNDAIRSLAMVVASCGDANGFVADNVHDAITSINLALLTIKQRPAQVICSVSDDKAFIKSQIAILQAFVDLPN